MKLFRKQKHRDNNFRDIKETSTVIKSRGSGMVSTGM